MGRGRVDSFVGSRFVFVLFGRRDILGSMPGVADVARHGIVVVAVVLVVVVGSALVSGAYNSSHCLPGQDYIYSVYDRFEYHNLQILVQDYGKAIIHCGVSFHWDAVIRSSAAVVEMGEKF